MNIYDDIGTNELTRLIKSKIPHVPGVERRISFLRNTQYADKQYSLVITSIFEFNELEIGELMDKVNEINGVLTMRIEK